MWKRTAMLAAMFIVQACGVVDTSELAPIDDYASWYNVETTGELPAHGDTIRAIYVNDIALDASTIGKFPVGSVVVKEVYQSENGNRGDLKYLALMRKLDEAPPGGELDEGWLFTIADDPLADETRNARCWRTCHVAAPYDGVFLRYE